MKTLEFTRYKNYCRRSEGSPIDIPYYSYEITYNNWILYQTNQLMGRILNLESIEQEAVDYAHTLSDAFSVECPVIKKLEKNLTQPTWVEEK